MLYRICKFGKHKIWFWKKIPLPKFINRWISKYRVWKLEMNLQNQLAKEIQEEIDAEIIENIRKQYRIKVDYE